MQPGSPSDATEPVTVEEFRQRAEKLVPAPVWQYYRTGADQEITLARNSAAFDSLVLRPRVLRDVHNIDTSTTLFGKHYDFPIALAPTAYQKLVGGAGELDTYRASQALGIGYTLSMNSTTSLEDVVGASTNNPSSSRGGNPQQYPAPWFQLYCLGNRQIAKELISRAESSGYEAIVLTVDAPVTGNRLHERKSPLKLPDGLTRANISSQRGASKGRLVLNARTAKEARKLFMEGRETMTDSSLTWSEIVPWIKGQIKGGSMKLIVKGIMTAEDAVLAVEAGVDGLVVSNHGGRQLDGVPATLEVLPEVVDAVKGRIPVIFDGGITRGSDVFKALALGAQLCLVGRGALWGLACDGQRGVESVMHILERELSRTMALSGAATVADISRDMVGVRKAGGFGIAKL